MRPAAVALLVAAAALAGGAAGWALKPTPAPSASIVSPSADNSSARVTLYAIGWRAGNGTDLALSNVTTFEPGSYVVDGANQRIVLAQPAPPDARVGFLVHSVNASGSREWLALGGATLDLLQNGTSLRERGFAWAWHASSKQLFFHTHVLAGCLATGEWGGAPSATVGALFVDAAPGPALHERLFPGSAIEGGCPDAEIELSGLGPWSLLESAAT